MDEIKKEMQKLISKEGIQKAFDERFPKDIQKKLENAHVAIAGLGGLGSNIAVMLARSGIGHLFLVDYDTVDVTNLNRQMYMIPQIGKPKTEAIKEILYQINPYLEYTSENVKVTDNNIKELFGKYKYVCEAFDKAEEKAMLVNGLLTNCPDTTVVSGNGMAGFKDINDIKTRKVMEKLYVCGDESTDIADGIGLMAPRVCACAAHQANKIIQLILEV